MNLQQYRARRAALATPTHRVVCPQCRKAVSTCYCARLKPFRAPVDFVILQHPEEARNTIATARMAHLSITNSKLLVGKDFSADRRVLDLFADETLRHVMLYPSPQATPIERLFDKRDEGPRDDRRLVFWLLDAKWCKVPQMLRLSPNIKKMPMAVFKPSIASRFQIRRQPNPACLSTIESIHLVIDLVQKTLGSGDRAHDALLDVFDWFVDFQLAFVGPGVDSRHAISKAARAKKRAERGEATAAEAPAPTYRKKRWRPVRLEP